MLLNSVKGYVVLRLRNTVVLFILFAVILSFVFYQATSLESQEKRLKGEFRGLQQKLVDINNTIAKSKDVLGVWSTLDSSIYSARGGINLEKANQYIEDLKQKYYITDVVVDFSNPKIRKDLEKDSELLDVQYCTVNLSFNAYADTYAFQFVRDLLSQLEGYIHIKSFEILADDFNAEVLGGIESGVITKMIKVRVSLIWHQIKDQGS